jgi:hypothetical protein
MIASSTGRIRNNNAIGKIEEWMEYYSNMLSKKTNNMDDLLSYLNYT